MIIFLYGENTYNSKKKLKKLKDKFKKDIDFTGDSLSVINGENTSIDEINKTTGSASLFSKKRMIIIENIFLNKNKEILGQVYELFKKNKDDNDNIIIFFDKDLDGNKKKTKLFKFLDNQKFTQDFKVLSNIEIIQWIKNEVIKHGGKISNQTVNLLVSIFGTNLWQLNNEINKLVNFQLSNNNPEITNNDVNNLCVGKADENIFALTDAISVKNKPLAMSLFNKCIEDVGMNEQYLLTMIIRQFKILLQVKELSENNLSQQKIINKLKLHPFIIKKSLSQINYFSLEIIKSIFQKLIEIDYKIKTGKSNLKIDIELLISEL